MIPHDKVLVCVVRKEAYDADKPDDEMNQVPRGTSRVGTSGTVAGGVGDGLVTRVSDTTVTVRTTAEETSNKLRTVLFVLVLIELFTATIGKDKPPAQEEGSNEDHGTEINLPPTGLSLGTGSDGTAVDGDDDKEHEQSSEHGLNTHHGVEDSPCKVRVGDKAPSNTDI